MTKTYKVRKIVRGKAEGLALVHKGSFSFLGDVDLQTGEIIAKDHPAFGQCVKDKILIFNETKGSSGGMVVLLTLFKKGLAPSGIVTVKPVDYNLAEGAILAKVPFACQPDGDILSEISTGSPVILDADQGLLHITS